MCSPKMTCVSCKHTVISPLAILKFLLNIKHANELRHKHTFMHSTLTIRVHASGGSLVDHDRFSVYPGLDHAGEIGRSPGITFGL